MRKLTAALTLAFGLVVAGVSPATAQDVADDTYEEEGDGMDLGWLGLLGLAGLLGLRRRPDHVHTHTTHTTPPPTDPNRPRI